uniref:uncharacterized protein LOC106998690 n=1 Tax=Macaca mulatta TaxID=9544 RepID=UPI0010A1FA78|nr:uncharacterized protein LOC106998690 [Macaca mulatta]
MAPAEAPSRAERDAGPTGSPSSSPRGLRPGFPYRSGRSGLAGRRRSRRGAPSCVRPRPPKQPELRNGGGGGAFPIWRPRLTSPEDVAESARKNWAGRRRKRRAGTRRPDPAGGDPLALPPTPFLALGLEPEPGGAPHESEEPGPREGGPHSASSLALRASDTAVFGGGSAAVWKGSHLDSGVRRSGRKRFARGYWERRGALSAGTP